MYQQLIVDLDPACPDAAGVEGHMRLQYGTLDHLDRDTFRQEIEIARECERQAPGHLERCADSYGTRRPDSPGPRPEDPDSRAVLAVTPECGDPVGAAACIRLATGVPASRTDAPTRRLETGAAMIREAGEPGHLRRCATRIWAGEDTDAATSGT